MTNSTEIASYPSERRNSQSSGALPSVEYGLIRAHVFASLVTLVVSVLFGLLVATKFSFPEFLGCHGWLTWFRIRSNNPQAIFIRCTLHAFLTFLPFSIQLLTNRPL